MDEAYLDLEEQMFEDGLSELERKTQAQRKVREQEEIERDLTNNGVFGRYVESRRLHALQAMSALAHAKPDDAVKIAVLQAEIREYLRCCMFVTTAFNEAEQAAQTLEEEFGPSHGQGQDDEGSDRGHQQRPARKPRRAARGGRRPGRAAGKR